MLTKIIKYSLLMFVLLGICAETDQNVCGGLYTYYHGEITSPNYPNSYPIYWECKWNITVAKNHTILLVFEDFFTYESDFLNVYDTNNGNIHLLGRFSFSRHPKHLISAQNHFYLNFSTTVSRKGFKLSYKTLDSGCGGIHRSLSDTIKSPGYPLNYYEDLNCTWNIVCPANRIINIKFNDVHLENKHAYLSIEDSSNLLTNLTDTNSQISLIARNNKVALKFISDKSPNSKGFRGFSVSYNCVIVGTNLTFLISAANSIIITDPNKPIDKILFNSVFKHTIIDYNIRENKLILYDSQHKQIIPNFFEQRITRIQINNELNLMAYDWIHEIFYWIDTQTSDLNAMDFSDNSYEKVSISEVLAQNQRDLLINVEKYVLIWSEIGVEPKLWTINSDGTDQKVLYSNSRQAFHLTIDYQTKRYYFVDIIDFSLFSIDFNGNNEYYLMTSKRLLDSLIQMTAIDNDIYLANNLIIYRVSELSNRRPEILFKSYEYDSKQNQLLFDYKSVEIKRQKIFGFKIVDQKLQPNFSNNCVNSQCTGFCLPTARSFRCINSMVTNAPVIMVSGQNHTTLPILNSVIIAFLIISLILLYFSLKQIIVKLENRIFQVLVPAVTFRKSRDSKHEYENHDYEEPVFKN